LPTVLDWKYMLMGCGNGAILDDTKMNYTCFNAKLATVGTALQNDLYWTLNDGSCVGFDGTEADFTNSDESSGTYNVRAVLAF